jgi:hypothetical protein
MAFVCVNSTEIVLISNGETVKVVATDQTLTLNQCLNYQVNLQRANSKPHASSLAPTLQRGSERKVDAGAWERDKPLLDKEGSYGSSPPFQGGVRGG